MPRDPLADVVRSLRLIGGVFLDGHFTAPWAIVSKVSKEDCKPFLPVPKQEGLIMSSPRVRCW